MDVCTGGTRTRQDCIFKRWKHDPEPYSRLKHSILRFRGLKRLDSDAEDGRIELPTCRLKSWRVYRHLPKLRTVHLPIGSSSKICTEVDNFHK
jgi:hypothetical protein